MSQAYTREILPYGSGPGEGGRVHQTSPAWVLTFVRWAIRDTLRTQGTKGAGALDLTSKSVMIVENDCIDVKVVQGKTQFTPSMEATLKITDTNYTTALAPGDFVFVNMLNWETDARDLIKRINGDGGGKANLNNANDGFKGFFKVQSVRESIMVDPTTGTKMVVAKVTGFAFTEFNNAIYFNPYLLNAADKSADLLFSSYYGQFWYKVQNKKGTDNVQDIIAMFIQAFLGSGASGEGKKIGNSLLKNPNTHFFMPSVVGNLLGQVGVKAAKDVYYYTFGVQKYASGSSLTLESGMNPVGLTPRYGGRFFYTPLPCDGRTLLKAEYWNNVKTWSIMNQYLNAPLNEMFTCFRIGSDSLVMPTVIMRQIPFTTEGLKSITSVTKFMNLPRWKIAPALILNYDLGRDEAARINFVQVFGSSVNDKSGSAAANETARGNYVYDINDVQRNGLRPYIVSSQFDEINTNAADKDAYRSPTWAKIIGDALIGGELKMSGAVLALGIQDPIAPGDNFQINDTVYHIEQVEHSASIAADGKKIFRTKLSLSNGVSLQSENLQIQYAEMDYSVAQADRTNDFNNLDGIKPGVSEAQDTYTRRNSDIDIGKSKEVNSPFQQPNKATSKAGNSAAKKPKKV